MNPVITTVTMFEWSELPREVRDRYLGMLSDAGVDPRRVFAFTLGPRELVVWEYTDYPRSLDDYEVRVLPRTPVLV